ncbi:MAG: divergent polysaccharide deacetylase family protein [Alphaproteobacteria bacterium]|nr:divergent polysaccharide deacetylase family protein [Alphaproteobacteria bacterium]
MPEPAAKASPLRAPLLAGLSAAVLIAGGAGVLSWLAGGEPAPVRASAEISRPDATPLATADHAERADPFADAAAEDVSLPGVTETETALAAAPEPEPRATPAPARRTVNAPPAPLEGLFEAGPGGAPLPVIAADGTRPDQGYAAPFEGSASAPTIALIVGGLGLSERLTEQAIETLPAEVTLSFAPYADNLQDWIDRARADGHEVLVELPMEPFDYPNNDPGPHTLLAEASDAENERRLLWLLSRASGYAGVTNYLGARLGADRAALAGVLSKLEARGLSVFHDGAGRRPVITAAAHETDARLAIADRVIDVDPAPQAVDRRLLELEALALQNGDALGVGFAYPATVDTVANWAEDLVARGYQLAPASFLMQVRRAREEPET